MPTRRPADAMAWAWEHRIQLGGIANPAGYLVRVGQSASRRYRRRRPVFPTPPAAGEPNETDPRLAPALAALSPRQRAAVLLVHGYGYDLKAAAALLGCSVSSLRNHVARGIRRLRARLGDAT